MIGGSKKRNTNNASWAIKTDPGIYAESAKRVEWRRRKLRRWQYPQGSGLGYGLGATIYFEFAVYITGMRFDGS